MIQELHPNSSVVKFRLILRKQLSELSQLRDYQTQEKQLALNQATCVVPSFLKLIHQKRRKAQKNVKAFLAGISLKKENLKFQNLALDFRKLPEQPIPNHLIGTQLAQALTRTFKNFEKSAQLAQDRSPSSLHAARIDFKEFRYTREALQAIFPISKLTQVEFKRVQNILGEIQDAFVLEYLILEYMLDSKSARLEPEILKLLDATVKNQKIAAGTFTTSCVKTLDQLRPFDLADNTVVSLAA
jgi:CHAD domain-containing protein